MAACFLTRLLISSNLSRVSILEQPFLAATFRVLQTHGTPYFDEQERAIPQGGGRAQP